MKIAMVVAHPDDEIFWGGGLPLRYPGDWTIISCSTPVYEPRRLEEFKRACAALGAKSVMYPEQDISKKTPLKHLQDINLDAFDHIVTHNKWGEYGHPHHKQIHQYISSRYEHKPITTFGFSLRGISIFGRRWQGRGKHQITLSGAELEHKTAALKEYNCLVKHGNSERPLWEELTENYCGKKGLSFSVETYDGAWFD